MQDIDGVDSEGMAQPQGQKPKPKAKNSAAVALGKLGGARGGPARAAPLSPEKRAEIAAKAAKARWSKKFSA